MTTPAGERWYDGPVPGGHRGGRLRFVPLGPDLLAGDHDAVMASRDQLRVWSASGWPADDFPIEDDLADLVEHEREHLDRVAFTYSVLADDSDVVLGCLYVHPFTGALRTRGVEPPVLDEPGPADACVRGWVRSDVSGRLDELVGETIGWLAGPAWAFPQVWWHAPDASTDQLAAAARAGLVHEVVVADGRGGSWRFLRRP